MLRIKYLLLLVRKFILTVTFVSVSNFFVLCSGGANCGFFMKIPDCLGGGYECANICGKMALTCRFLQKPVLCSQTQQCSCLDFGSACNFKEDMCIRICQMSSACVCLCLCEITQNCECGLMKTCCKGWNWCLCIDMRCAVPCETEYAPIGCTFCGCGWRQGSGCGCQVQSIKAGGEAPWGAINSK